MTFKNHIITAALVAGFAAGTLGLGAADKPSDAKAKPYPLKTCVVTDEEIGKDPDMKPHVFTYKGQEVKLCCKGCLKDFEKDPAKYTKKIADAQKK
jgi:YHS domain-containing protein